MAPNKQPEPRPVRKLDRDCRLAALDKMFRYILTNSEIETSLYLQDLQSGQRLAVFYTD